jgi:DNA-binding response OmpR family regulator
MPRLMVVEDDVPIANMYKFKLEQVGHEVACAHDGQTGFDLAKEFRPDLILLDLKMPVKNGDEMLAELRSSEWGYKIPVIILTNVSKHEVPPHLRFLHVDRYIVKAHHTPAQVSDVINEVLAKRMVAN